MKQISMLSRQTCLHYLAVAADELTPALCDQNVVITSLHGDVW